MTVDRLGKSAHTQNWFHWTYMRRLAEAHGSSVAWAVISQQ
jgi:hypothetical protein